MTADGRPLFPLPVALLLAAAAGPLLDAAFPDRGWWWMAFPAIGIALLATTGRSFGGGLLVGLVFGATFYWPHIEWASEFLGPLPWSALSAVMTLWTGVAGGLVALATRWIPRAWPGLAGRVLLLPAVVGGIWTAREAIASVWPYGGFSWGRVAFSQSQGPFRELFAWLGSSGVTFVLVTLVALALAATAEAARRPRLLLDLGAAVALATLVLASAPAWTSLPGTTAAAAGTDGSVRVGAVQGDTKAGYFDPPERFGDNLLGQVAATEPLLGEDVDVVVWPEGGSDADPERYAWAARLWDEVAAATGAPLVGGTIQARETGEVDAAGDPVFEYFNSVLLWRAGEGVVDRYDKKHPVPFGEYVPDRALWRTFAPDLIDLIQREYTPGTTDAVFELDDGVVAGNAICFDIVDDQLRTEMILQGAQIIFAESNNADFGRTDESVQQLEIARVRALETARTVVVISTVGTSALLGPDGSTLQQVPWYEPAVLVADVPVLDTVTPAVLIGRGIEWAASLLGLGSLVAAGLAIRPRRPGRA